MDRYFLTTISVKNDTSKEFYELLQNDIFSILQGSQFNLNMFSFKLFLIEEDKLQCNKL